jgi:hypothetical protein
MKYHVLALCLVALGSVSHAVNVQEVADQAASLVSQVSGTKLPTEQIAAAFASFRVSPTHKFCTIKIAN